MSDTTYILKKHKFKTNNCQNTTPKLGFTDCRRNLYWDNMYINIDIDICMSCLFYEVSLKHAIDCQENKNWLEQYCFFGPQK